MRVTAFFAAMAAALLACHSQQATVYAETEGVRFAAEPPTIRPARTGDPRLRSQDRGRLVIHAQVVFQPTVVNVVIAPLASPRTPIETSTNSAGVLESPPLASGDYLVTVRHVGLAPQTVGVRVASGYADTLLFGLGQP